MDSMLTELSLSTGRLLILGYFNLHFDKPGKRHYTCAHGLTKGGWSETACHATSNIDGQTPHYVISREESDLLSDLKALPRCLSGHNGMSGELRMTRPVIAPMKALARHIRNVDHAKFPEDLAVKFSTLGEEHDVDAAAQHCTGFIISVLDRHAP